MARMTLKVKGKDLYFRYQLRVSHDACLVQIPAQICHELSCKQGKVYERTNGQRDRRTDAGNGNTPSAWKSKG